MSGILKTEVAKPLQPTVIESTIETIVAKVTADIAALNIDKMEVSEENKQKIKQTRSKLAKDLKMYEDERKKIKNFVLEPYNEFEQVYNKDLKKILNEAIAKLDKKKNEIEDGQLAAKIEYGEDYFAKKLVSNPISEAADFDLVDVKMSINISNKKIREAIDAHFEKIESALLIIDQHAHPARLMAIWKTDAKFDIGVALTRLSTQLANEKKTAYRGEEIKTIVPETPPQPEPEKEEKPVVGMPEEVYDFTLHITVTEDQLAGLSLYLEENNIEFSLDE